MSPFQPPDGTLTPGNTSSLHDGAAFVVVVSQRVWEELGKPAALRLVASAVQGVTPDNEGVAPIEAMKKLYSRLNGFNRDDIGLVEMSESSAAQVIAMAEALGIDPDYINPEGGAVVRGHPLGAAGAVLVVRLFSGLVRSTKKLAAACRHRDARSPRRAWSCGHVRGHKALAFFDETDDSRSIHAHMIGP